jgi:hypothetical protein
MELQPSLGQAEIAVPFHALRLPVLEPLHVRPRLDEELHLHLLELARTKDEVSGCDLVAKRLADLGNAERDLLARRLLDVEKIHVDALRSFRTQIDDGGRILERSHESLEHEIELARFAQCSLHAARGALRVRRAGRALYLRVVGAKALLAVAAIDQRIHEAADMAARLPYSRVHQDGRIESLDVRPRAHHRVPPALLDVLLELDAERAVIPD